MLLVCAGGDQVWQSCPNAKAIVARRGRLPTTLLDYPLAGHGIADPEPNLSVHFENQLTGFAPGDNARADADAWPRLLAFLRNP
jgi:dienelactone hydrolase